MIFAFNYFNWKTLLKLASEKTVQPRLSRANGPSDAFLPLSVCSLRCAHDNQVRASAVRTAKSQPH